MTKVCSKCNCIKSILDFNKLKSSADGHQHTCRTCFSEYNKLRYSEKKEHILATVTKYRMANQDTIKQGKKQWVIDTLDVRIDHRKKYYLANKEQRLSKMRKWVENNRDAVNAYSKKWASENREKRLITSRLSSAKRRSTIEVGKVSTTVMDVLMSEQGGKCPGCLSTLDASCHLDHFMPIALGGLHDDSNLQLLCPGCNFRKSAKHPTKWLSSLIVL